MSTQVEPQPLAAPQGAAPPADAPAPPVTLIAPPRGWQVVDLGELWRFRELIFILAWRDVKVRYKQTVLGAAWAVLQPGLMMVVFTIFFSKLAGVKSSGDVPYPLFAYAGLLPWTFFATAVTNAANSVVGSERLITKVYFPRLALPFAAAAAAVVDFAIAFALLLVVMPFFGVWPGWGLLAVPLIFLVLLVGAAAVGTLLAGLYVSYRDFRYVTPFLVQLWMFATPSIYMAADAVGGEGWVRVLLTLNPLTGLITAFRAACLGGDIPWLTLAGAAAAAVAGLVGACLYFRRVEDWFADII